MNKEYHFDVYRYVQRFSAWFAILTCTGMFKDLVHGLCSADRGYLLHVNYAVTKGHKISGKIFNNYLEVISSKCVSINFLCVACMEP